MSVFEAVCDHLPEPATTTKVCKEEVDKIFPVAINFIIAAVVSSKLEQSFVLSALGLILCCLFSFYVETSGRL